MATGWATTANTVVDCLLEECIAQIAAAGPFDVSSSNSNVANQSVTDHDPDVASPKVTQPIAMHCNLFMHARWRNGASNAYTTGP